MSWVPDQISAWQDWRAYAGHRTPPMNRATAPESAPDASPASEGRHSLIGASAARIDQIRMWFAELDHLELEQALEASSGQLNGEHLLIRNERQRSRALGKSHLVTTSRWTGLQRLHSVCFLDPTFNLPTSQGDSIAGHGVLSAAIVGLSPVADALPESAATLMAQRSRPPMSQIQELPPWGPIFSSIYSSLSPAPPRRRPALLMRLASVWCWSRRVRQPPNPIHGTIQARWLAGQGRLSMASSRNKTAKTDA